MIFICVGYLSLSQHLRCCLSYGSDFGMKVNCWASSVTSCSVSSLSLAPRPRCSLKLIWTACWKGQRWRQTSREGSSLQVWLRFIDSVLQNKGKQVHAFVIHPDMWCGARLSFCLPDERIDPAELKGQEWLFPETTAGFHDLPLQYNGFCGYTLVNRDGLLLPGPVFTGVLQCHQE